MNLVESVARKQEFSYKYSKQAPNKIYLPGIPNNALDILGSMGITCCSRTAKKIINTAGEKCSMLIKKVVEFGEATHKDAIEDALTLLDELMEEQYLYMGRNYLPHRMIYNGTYNLLTYITVISKEFKSSKDLVFRRSL